MRTEQKFCWGFLYNVLRLWKGKKPNTWKVTNSSKALQTTVAETLLWKVRTSVRGRWSVACNTVELIITLSEVELWATGWTAGVRFPTEASFLCCLQRPGRLGDPPSVIAGGRRELKRPGREVDHSSPFSTGVKNDWTIIPLPRMSSWGSVFLSTGTTLHFNFLLSAMGPAPITMAARSNVFARSNADDMSSNPTRGMDICVRLFCVCIVLCVNRGLATGWSLVQGVLPNVYRIMNLQKWQGPRNGRRTIDECVSRSSRFKHFN
jgi:hypothetical protein